MSQGAIVAVSILSAVLCSGSSLVSVIMSGGEETTNTTGPTGPTGPTGRVLPKARYVTLRFHDNMPTKYVLTPLEIKVFDKSGTNLALEGSISDVGSHHDESRFPRGAVIDGDETTLWHSAHGSDTDFITIDLGADKEISKIEVLNVTGTTKYNGVESRARMSGGGPDSSDKGAYIELKNAAGSVVKTTHDIKIVAAKYTIDFDAYAPQWK